MTVTARTAPSRSLPVNGLWTIEVRTLDPDGVADDAPVTVTITTPDGGTITPTVESLPDGRSRAEYVVTATGRYVATASTASSGSADFTAWVDAVVAGEDMPSIADLDDYLGTHSWSDDDLQEALDAEAAQQRNDCLVPAAYPANLRSALLRRAQFHLAMKRVMLGVIPGDADRDTTRIGRDPEIRRLEKGNRRLPTG